MMIKCLRIVLLTGWLVVFPGISGFQSEVKLGLIELPPGFTIKLYVDHLPGARSLTLSPVGTLYVGTRDEGGLCGDQP
jgi:hypothetical protein